jgi:Na+/melibiose symporter-like transporter
VGALLEPRNRRALYVGVSLMLFQQITGQPSVLYYAVDTFRAAGFASSEAATQVSVLLGGFKLAMTLIAVATVDKLGRRPLLLGGVSALTASLVALAFLASDSSPLSGTASAYASLALLLCFVGAYQVSFGPISWLLVGEVFPSSVRSAAVGCATVVNFGSNAVVSAVLPSIQASAGQAGTYTVFAALGGLSLLSIYLTVPETRGKSLEQIEADWAE